MLAFFFSPYLVSAQCGQISFGPATPNGAGVVFDVIFDPKGDILVKAMNVSITLLDATGTGGASAQITALTTQSSLNPFFVNNGFTVATVNVPTTTTVDMTVFKTTPVSISQPMVLFKVFITGPSLCYLAKITQAQLIKPVGSCSISSGTLSTVGSSICISGIDIGGTIEKAVATIPCIGSINNGIPMVAVKIWNLPTAVTACNTQTAANGKYLCNVPSGQDYRIEPTKTGNLNCGVTELDAAMILQQITGNLPTLKEVWQRIAADLNGDGKITTVDNVQISNIILGNPTPFASWAFVPTADYFKIPIPTNLTGVPKFDQFIQLTSPATMSTATLKKQGFVGIKKGDVNGSCSDCGGLIAPEKVSAGNPNSIIEVVGEDKQLNSGEVTYIRFKAKKFIQNSVYALHLDYNSELLEVLELKAMGLENLAHHIDIENNTVKMFGFSDSKEGLSLKDDETLFLLKVRAKKDLSSIENALWQSKEIVGNQVFSINLEAEKFELTYEKTNDNTFLHPTQMLGNIPNPFKDETLIRFTLAHAGATRITVSDVAGRIVSSYEGIFKAGNNDYLFQYSNDYTGLLFYKIESGEATLTGKMLKIN